MVDVSRAMESKYITAELIKESPTKKCVIIDGGEYVESTYDGKTFERFQLNVEIDGKKKIWNVNKDSVKNISAEYGKNSTMWIGKVIQLSTASIKGKDTVIGMPALMPKVSQESI